MELSRLPWPIVRVPASFKPDSSKFRFRNVVRRNNAHADFIRYAHDLGCILGIAAIDAYPAFPITAGLVDWGWGVGAGRTRRRFLTRRPHQQAHGE
jgi:hypothetical protein